MPTFDLSNEEIIDEVRAALAGLTQSEVPDDSIIYAVKRISEPWVSSQASAGDSQDKYEAAILTYGAELAFASWYSTSRMRDVELEVFKEPRVYRDKLEQRTDATLSSLGITRPPRRKHHQEVAHPNGDSE